MNKTRLNVSLDCDLADFIKNYVKENRTTVSEFITQFLFTLKRRSEGDSMETIYSDPDFYKSI